MKKRYRMFSFREPEDDVTIYRESEARECLTPDEFTVYQKLPVEDQVNVAHLLLTALQVQKAKLLLKAFARESIGFVKPIRNFTQLRLMRLVTVRTNAQPGAFLTAN